jgi:hypothetical protein
MNRRRVIEFTTDIETVDKSRVAGEFSPAGELIATSLKSQLEVLGARCGQIAEHDNIGWDLTCHWHGRQFLVFVGAGSQYLSWSIAFYQIGVANFATATSSLNVAIESLLDAVCQSLQKDGRSIIVAVSEDWGPWSL